MAKEHDLDRRGFLKTAAALAAASTIPNFASSLTRARSLEPGRTTVDLSGSGWKLWRDKAGAWRQEALYIQHEPTRTFKRHDDPEISDPEQAGKWKLADLPVALPTGGWAALDSKAEAEVSVPGSVEEYLWGKDGDPAIDNLGDYIGVSWWWRQIDVPASTAGKRSFLDFESVNRRAEIFLDGRLVGYDCIGNTPFSSDVTDFVKPGQMQRLAVRITKPGGFLGWADNPSIAWGADVWQSGGKHPKWSLDKADMGCGITVNMSRGIAGILGAVKLRIVDPVHITDLWVRNKPSRMDVEPTLEVANESGHQATGTFQVEIREKASGKQVFHGEKADVTLPSGSSRVVIPAHVPEAKLWSVTTPNLYECRVRLTASDSSFADEAARTFGFRWFDVSGIGTNAAFRLNGKRVVLLSAISWGFWPVTGIVPTPDMAAKQVSMAKRLGLNMLNFHRAIGQPLVLDEADNQGLLYLEEPGGYEGYNADAFGCASNREKLLRMVKRDRSHPSLIIYNMVNENYFRKEGPTEGQKRDVTDAHAVDPTRILTWTSGGTVGKPGKPWPARLWMRPGPGEATQYTLGHYDTHQTHSAAVYLDGMYAGPDCFLKRSPYQEQRPIFSRGDQDPGEIIFWGEEGAIGTPPRLQLIYDDHQRPGQLRGWDGDFFIQQYHGYARSLQELGMDRCFTVDSLSQAIGEKEFYYHGRIIENVKINNVTDGYVVNGWENDKDTTFSGLVDLYRHPKTDKVELIADYARPLYVAVKLRHKIAHTGEEVSCDFWIVNEVDLRGDAILKAALESPGGPVLEKHSYPVKLTGGDVYGELLVPDVKFNIRREAGYYTVRAELSRDSRPEATGTDQVFVVDWKSASLPEHGEILDSSGEIAAFLEEQKGLKLPKWDGATKLDYVVIGQGDYADIARIDAEILDRVEKDGLTAIVIGRSQAEAWAQLLANRGRITFDGVDRLGDAWIGGSYFGGESPLLTGFPQRCVLNWEYQLFAATPRENYDYGILKNPPTFETNWALYVSGKDIVHVIGAQNGANDKLSSAVCVVRCSKGRVLLSSLDMIPYLNCERQEAHTVRKLFCNYLQYGVQPVP